MADSTAPAAPSSCHGRGTGLEVLPDPSCTPGATNPAVAQSSIGTTICVSGWTATVRPPESVTEPLKIAQMASYGDTGPISTYEEDHLVPLELGGATQDPRNLWPEPGASPNPKDRVENAAKTAVCDHTLGLVAAQTAIAADWIAFGEQLGIAPRLIGGAGPRGPAVARITTVIVDALDITAEAFAEGTGWQIKPEGACKAEVCVPLPQTGTFDARATAARLGMAVVSDAGSGLWCIGPESLGDRALVSAEAPELVLDDINGDEFRLSSLRGQKVLLVSWAPY